jgi:DNA mismatch repair ATPase MutL
MSTKLSNSVEKIADPVANLVRAACVYPSLNRVVEELIFNSLDANSGNIEIRIDFKTLSIEVNDDGTQKIYELNPCITY